jgi:hypothetical protein
MEVFFLAVQLIISLEVCHDICFPNSFIAWDLLKKKISLKMTVLRPTDEALYKLNVEKGTNHSENHILNNVFLNLI